MKNIELLLRLFPVAVVTKVIDNDPKETVPHCWYEIAFEPRSQADDDVQTIEVTISTAVFAEYIAWFADYPIHERHQ